MRKFLLAAAIFILSIFSATTYAQSNYPYDPSPEHPFGQLNPDAPEQVADYKQLIGECSCKSVARIDQNTWADTLQMTWRFKYIMNGMAVQDETLKSDGLHAGSIRQYIPDSARWFVHFYSSGAPSTTLPSWEGGKVDDGKIILYRPQQAPNGMEGFYKITFSNISETGFNWNGEWVDTNETFSYPTWNIFCTKTKS